MRRLLLVLAINTPCQADDFFNNRPAFSQGDLPAKTYARCEDVRAMSANMSDPGYRIDLSVSGRLTLVRTDGALWYLVICSDVRIMCITYQSNGMKVGDLVSMKGAYQRLDANHATLDPCLANISEH